MSGEVGAGEKADFVVTIYLRSQIDIIHYVRKLFLSARELCCCPPTRGRPSFWLTYETDLSRHRYRVYSGLMSRQSFIESRQIAATIRSEITRSFTSSRRQPHGTLRYIDSDSFQTRIADLLKVSRLKNQLNTPIAEVPELDDETRSKLSRVLGLATVGDLLTTDRAVLARALEIDPLEIAQMKRNVLRGITERRAESGGRL
jgi:hypothetical protein